MTIYVGNLAPSVEAIHLENLFIEYGRIKSIGLPRDPVTRAFRGFALIEMENDSDEDSACAGLDHTELLGKKLSVNKAKSPETKSTPSRLSPKNSRSYNSK